MVNNIFIEKAKKETEEAHKRGDHYFRSNYTTLMSIKEQREVYEKQILHELEDLPETPSLQAIKLQFRETFSENVNRKPKTPVESMKDENMSIIKSKNEKLMEAAKKSNPLQ